MEELLHSPYLSLLLLPLCFLILNFFITRSRKTPKPIPLSPTSLPIIGHLHLLHPPLHQSLHRLTSRYGPIVKLRLGSTPAILVGSADATKELIKTHDQDLADRPIFTAVRHFAYESSGFAFAPYGPYWRFMKKLCMSELLSSRTVDGLAYIRRRELLALLRTLAAKSAAAESIDLSKELIRMTTSVIAGMTTGTASAGDSEAARKAVKGVAEIIGSVNLGDFIGFLSIFDLQGLRKRMKEVRDNFDALMERIMASKEASRKSCGVGVDGNKDLLDILLDAAEDREMEIQLTTENIKSFILDVFTAGSDSSAATTEWALAELINHPEQLKKAREEIDNTVGKDRLIDESDIQNLIYLQAVVKETLRLHPAAPMAMRKATKEIKHGEFELRKGNTIIFNVYSVNRDPKYWDEPLEFRPSRFLEDGELSYKGMHFHYLPFGSGRRMCPGVTLAVQVITVALAALIQCFEWGGKEKLDMSEGPGMVILRAKPFVCFPKTRLHPLPPELLGP
ncbi:3,9-dihydroxypterocarpan 6A-monooxygenase-like [Phalaenopsis equestris]|uniref:3,9-dihydroxypterocarpan 6A-monooxygenase-like n=1 Tax=Phalaenopsis equestris TaxID=78828 RepID=UPI0009E38A50|nr:3,9-dihydroxypterocarpan 6A-monooxygenase-like [Phalaenopsis equestris]